MYQSGFIAIVGRPNAGKSTLLNALMAEKIVIISNKPQTTRNNIQGILTKEDVQYVFIDTPGVHKPQHELGKTLNRSAYNALKDVDVIYLIVDASAPYGKGDEFLLSRIKENNAPIFLVLNKVDKLKKEKVMKLIVEWNERHTFKEIFPISAMNAKNLDRLLDVTKTYLPEGPKFFPDDMRSDHDDKFLISEMIREKVLYKTEEEIPHSVAVVLESIEEIKKDVHIKALIIVERDSQKGILIGKQGSMIKAIGTSARLDIERFLHKHIFLELFVRVEKNWRNKESKLQQFGIKEMDIDNE